MTVLITGATGQLGRDLAAHCRALGDRVVALSRAELDITDNAAVALALADAAPQVVINCAAWTAVDACEAEPDRAGLVNSTAVEYLGDACALEGSRLIQVSTDYVFDGTKTGPYLEADRPNPTSVYGRSKLGGEIAALARPGSVVVRTSWVCSAHANNMVATVMRLAGEFETLRFVDDQIGSPTLTVDLAVAIRNLVEAGAEGIFHCTNTGVVSWRGFAQAVLAAMGHDPARVLPIATSELDPPRPAARPANSVLANARYQELFDPLPGFETTLAKIVAERSGD